VCPGWGWHRHQRPAGKPRQVQHDLRANEPDIRRPAVLQERGRRLPLLPRGQRQVEPQRDAELAELHRQAAELHRRRFARRGRRPGPARRAHLECLWLRWRRRLRLRRRRADDARGRLGLTRGRPPAARVRSSTHLLPQYYAYRMCLMPDPAYNFIHNTSLARAWRLPDGSSQRQTSPTCLTELTHTVCIHIHYGARRSSQPPPPPSLRHLGGDWVVIADTITDTVTDTERF
jgi:hypothetical protein